MGKIVSLEISNKNTSLITYKYDSKELQKQIEEILEESGASEIGVVKSKRHEEYFYNTRGDKWMIHIDRAIWPQRYDLNYGQKKIDNISMYITLTGFNNRNLCNELYRKLSKIKSVDRISEDSMYISQPEEDLKRA